MTQRDGLYYLHLLHWEAKAQAGSVTCPKLHSENSETEIRLVSGQSPFPSPLHHRTPPMSYVSDSVPSL